MYFLCRDVRCAVGIATIRRLGRFAQMKMKKWMSDLAGRRQKEAFDRAYRYQNYWKNNGGITVSGGEPLLQIDFVTELLGMQKKRGFTRL